MAVGIIDFVNDPIGTTLFLTGLFGLVIVGLGWAAKMFPVPHPKAAAGVVGILVIFLLGGVVLASGVAAPSTGSITPAPSSASLSTYIVSSALESGCSVNTITNTMTCDEVYNTTSNYWNVQSTNASTCTWSGGACHKRNYIDLGLHSARVDALNATYGFVYQVASIPTVTTTGASPTVYSPIVGYTPATGTATGTWLMQWSEGSLANQNPSQAAPTTTANVAQNTVGINAFGASTATLNVTLPGSGGSSAPTTLYAALTTYASYSMTVTVQGSTPFTFTLTVIPIGEHA